MKEVINKLKHLPDDRIGDDIFAAYEWSEGKLIRLYLGSKASGPMLQYTDQGWTNCYSRGDFGRKYAHGGHWSGHTPNLHPRLSISTRDEKYEMLIDGGGNKIILPNGIKGDIEVTEIDCSGSWTIWYPTARQCVMMRIKNSEITQSSLPDVTKRHLLLAETDHVINCLNDVIEAYKL